MKWTSSLKDTICPKPTQEEIDNMNRPKSIKEIKSIITKRDFPGGAVVKNLPVNAGDMGSPWSGKIPLAAEQLSPRATTTDPVLESPQAPTTEAHVPRAHAPQQQKP